MQIVTDGRYAPAQAVLALGMFDGVHLAHRVLVKRARRIADDRRLPLVAVSFRHSPLAVIAPGRCPPPLTTLEERAALLCELGVDVLYLLPFDRAMMETPPECYIGELVRRFHPTDVVCGYNHSYGRGGAGTPAFLQALGEALGFNTSIVPRITLGGRDVSSSAIRELITRGELKAAGELLGRPYRIAARVVRTASGVARAYPADDVGANCVRPLLPPNGRYRAVFELPDARLPLTVELCAGRNNTDDAQGEAGGLMLLKRVW